MDFINTTIDSQESKESFQNLQNNDGGPPDDNLYSRLKFLPKSVSHLSNEESAPRLRNLLWQKSSLLLPNPLQTSKWRMSSLQLRQLSRIWADISRINFIPESKTDSSFKFSISTLLTKSSETPRNSKILQNADNEICPLIESYQKVVTPLLNEGNLWGCFYNFPEMYFDEYSPVVRVRKPDDVPSIVEGVLTRDVVDVCLTYLRRSPILHDYVYTKLDLSSKRLVNIEMLLHYKYLVYLDLSNNSLKDISVLKHLPYLQFLSLDFNRLETVLEYETPQWFLTEVHYTFNSVKSIRNLTDLWSITILNLSHNNIKLITGLENLTHLRHLNLSFNHICRLENLNNLPLIWLDLSNNNISHYEHGPKIGLLTLLHLEYLNLNDNRIASFKIFGGCTRISELHAKNNRLCSLLEMSVYTRQLRRLAILDLRGNHVCLKKHYHLVISSIFPRILNLDAKDIDPINAENLKMEMNPDVRTFATRRLQRLLYIEQLSRAKISRFVPPADTTEVPIVILVGHEASGKGSLARRISEECCDNIEPALQHTTCRFHLPGHYIVVTTEEFDEMLLSGDFLTYSERNGHSYGLSREQAFIKNKIKIATLDLVSALILELRGRRPYLILSTFMDKKMMIKKITDRHAKLDAFKPNIISTINLPAATKDYKFLETIISGYILVRGILQEIILDFITVNDSCFVIGSDCSLLQDNTSSRTSQNQRSVTNMSGSVILDNVPVLHQAELDDDEVSLQSLYKGSQHSSQIENEFLELDDKDTDNDKTSDDLHVQTRDQILSQHKSVEFKQFLIPNSEKTPDANPDTHSGIHELGVKSSKSVTFTKGSDFENIHISNLGTMASELPSHGSMQPRTISGLLIEPRPSASMSEAFVDKDKSHVRLMHSISDKLELPRNEMMPDSIEDSLEFVDDDRWLAFLADNGILSISDTNVKLSKSSIQCDCYGNGKHDDTNNIIKMLALNHAVTLKAATHLSYTSRSIHLDTSCHKILQKPTQSCYNIYLYITAFKEPENPYEPNVRVDYDKYHQENPGVFWDTLTMDDPDAAFIKLKKILKNIVDEQKILKPMFDIDFDENEEYTECFQQRYQRIRDEIATQRYFL